jgi:carboxylesterase type B
MKRISNVPFFLALACLGLAGCNDSSKSIVGVALQYNAGSVYTLGEKIKEPNNKLIVTYSDKTTSTLAMDDKDILLQGDTSSLGKATGTVTYQNNYQTTFSYTVYQPLDKSIAVTGGSIKGYADGNVATYKGIPYAASPTGENRWHAPKPVTPWNGDKECYHFGPSAYQGLVKTNDYFIDAWAGVSEDCLTLNVWSDDSTAANKPVFVYYHGGGFTTGGSSCPIYDGKALAEKGIVYVSVNYRLGAFGFLANEELKQENDGAGNFGILDAIQSLQWVHNNIAAFGGDPNNVTIAGQSAGGMMTNCLLCAQATAGLFKNAFVMSGNLINKTTPTIDEKIAGVKLNGKSLAELRQLSAAEAVSSVQDYQVGMSVDGVLYKDSQLNLLKSGVNKDVNVISGNVPGDSGIFGITGKDPNALLLGLQNYYALARLKGGAKHTYLYFYDYLESGAKECAHTDDVTCWLGNSTTYYSKEFSAADQAMSALASSYTKSFCLDGDPSGEGLTPWLASLGDDSYFHVNSTCEAAQLTAAQISAVKAAYPELEAQLG